ncbi:MAG: enoyl-CoA hydratase/isomerase family protein [Candidatus Zixiibacteriota bacterium]|nr:MAG: enoyl-CoA hydratase/isomerase family protein [candidate division Zixibacteria bacterium]
MADYKNLLVEKKDAILIVTISRERALNALNREVVAELQQLFSFYWSDEAVRCVIITGAGEKAFVAGADISELADVDVRSGTELSARGLYLMKTIQNFPKPVIAAINGFALGGGCELAMACDIRLASEKARLGQPEVNLGLIPGYGGTQRLPRLVGRGKAMQMIFTGDMVDAAEAHRVGLVDEVYPPDQLMDKAMEMAKTICTKGPVAVALAKECINRGLDGTLTAGCDLEKANFGQVCGTGDKNEGCEAFLEKRKPNFTGH